MKFDIEVKFHELLPEPTLGGEEYQPFVLCEPAFIFDPRLY